MMAIENRIEEVARARGITSIKALSDRTGLAYNTTHALWSKRIKRVDFETLEKLCEVLGVEPGDLIVRVQKEHT